MKYIFLMRHAKSGHPGGVADFERPLNDRGRKDAARMARFLKNIEFVPDAHIVSPAQRTRETVDILTGICPPGHEVKWQKPLYEGSLEDYVKAIQSAPASAERLMITGHNPGIEETVGFLCQSTGYGPIRMATGAVACFETARKEWQEIKPADLQLKWLMIPKLLRRLES